MPLLEEKRSHCQEDRTAINVKKKLPVKGGSYAKSPKTQFRSVFGISQGFSFYHSLRLLRVVITLEDPIINSFQQVVSELDTTTTDKTSDETGTKSGRTVTLTAEDMQKKKNDVKARTTLLLSHFDEHQLRFSKYKTARELWAAILKTFGGNKATKKTNKNLLKQQYGNFRAEGSETLEQTFSRLQAIVGQLQFMDVEVEQNDLNQKFLTILAPEWLMHTIVWRNRSDLDTMSLDDLYNHLKNMAFISSAKHSSGNEDGNTACVPTASTNVPIASASVATISQDTACAYIASQSSGSQIKFKDINQIDEDDMEEMDIKWNMALLSMRADKWVTLQQSAGLPEAKTEEGETTSDRELAQVESRLVEYKEREVKYIEKIRTFTFYNESNKECIETLKNKLETLKQENDGVDAKLAGLLTASKDLDNLIESQRSDKNKEGLGYTAVPPPPVQLYLSPKKDLSWTGLPECADDTVTDYSRPSPIVESTSEEDQNRNPSVSENVASPITPKPFIKFVKPKDSQSKSKIDKKETPKKPPVKYAKQNRKPNKKPNVRGNHRNWNNSKSHQLGPDFVMKKKACFNCGNFDHLAYDCRKRVKKNFTPRLVAHRPYRPSQRPMKTNMNDARPNRTFFIKQAHSYANRPVHRTSAVRSPYRAPWVSTVNRNYPPVNRKFSTGSRNFPTANRKFPTASRKFSTSSTKSSTADMGIKGKAGGCKITGKGTIKTGKLEFENVYFVKDLKYNLFSVSQICDNKNSVLFTDSECIVLGRDFKLLDDANILLRTPMQHNMYSIDLNNIVSHRDLTCLVAKASADE
nr:ribonuclease H-like domain-containing protein [Tanacetum cinerariifolium]